MRLTTSQRHRLWARAARDWQAGKPHSARQHFVRAGALVLWPTFQRTALTWNRARTQALLTGRSQSH